MRHDDRTNARDATLDREPRLTVERVRATVFGRRRRRRREGGARAQEEGKRSRQGQLDVRLRVAIKYQTIHSPPSSRASPRRRREKMPHPSPIAALSRALPRFRRSRAAPTKERARTPVSRKDAPTLGDVVLDDEVDVDAELAKTWVGHKCGGSRSLRPFFESLERSRTPRQPKENRIHSLRDTSRLQDELSSKTPSGNSELRTGDSRDHRSLSREW